MWVVFEDVVLAVGCRQSLREQRDLALERAKDEEVHARVEATVAVRTAELRRANAALQVEVSERSRIEDALRVARLRLASSPWSPHTPITRLFSLTLRDASNGSIAPSLALLDTKSTRFAGGLLARSFRVDKPMRGRRPSCASRFTQARDSRSRL